MRGNQPTATQEVPQSSFAMTILPGAAPARVRKERVPKERAPKDEAPAQPNEPRASRFTLRAHKNAAVDVVPPFETVEHVEAPEPFETPAPVEMAAPVEFIPPPPAPFSPPPAPAQFNLPPAPAQFAPAPPPAQFAPPPAPAQFAPAPPRLSSLPAGAGPVRSPAAPAQFNAPSPAPFAPPPPVHEEPSVSGWYAPVDEPAAEAPSAPTADYPPPTAYPMAPGYPPQPQYAEQSHFGYSQQAAPSRPAAVRRQSESEHVCAAATGRIVGAPARGAGRRCQQVGTQHWCQDPHGRRDCLRRSDPDRRGDPGVLVSAQSPPIATSSCRQP